MVTNSAAALATGDGLFASVSGNAEGPAVVLLHGLFGMGSNLGLVARALGDAYCTHQVDLPNHGRSPWVDDMSLPSLAASVRAYMDSVGVDAAVILGHSLGGKVAMELALTARERVLALVVADIAPIAYRGSHDDVFAAIAAVAERGPASRREASEIMAEHVDEPGVVQFLALSLRRAEDGVYRWRLNGRALSDNYDALRAPPSDSAPFNRPTVFIYGDQSSYITEAGMVAAKERFCAANFVAIPGAGHWLHAEQPELFNSTVREFLLREIPGAAAS